MAGLLNWTMRGETWNESEREVKKKGQVDQEISIAKMTELYRDQARGTETEVQSLGKRSLG